MDRQVIEATKAAHAALESRRGFLRKGGLALGGAGLLAVACTGGDGEAAAPTAAQAEGGGGGAAPADAGTSLFDRILDGQTVQLGADLTFPPLQFKTDDGEPVGYSIELAIAMFEDLGAEWEIVEIPFGELFAAQAAGRFDFSGIAATNLPARAQQVMFASEPLFVESNVILKNADSPVAGVEDLNDSAVTIAVLVGSSQEAVSSQMFPDATIKALEQQPAVQDAATGQSDVVMLGEFNVAQVLDENPSLEVLPGAPLLAHINTFFMPHGDFRMQAYVDNWLRYEILKGTMASRWIEAVAGPVGERGVQSTPVYSPYLAAGQVLFNA